MPPLTRYVRAHSPPITPRANTVPPSTSTGVQNNAIVQQSPGSYTLVLLTCLPLLGVLFALKWVFITRRRHKVSKLVTGGVDSVEQLSPLRCMGALHLESPVPSLSASSDMPTLFSIQSQNSKWGFSKKSAFWVGFFGSPSHESSQHVAVLTKLDGASSLKFSGGVTHCTSPSCSELGVLSKHKCSSKTPLELSTPDGRRRLYGLAGDLLESLTASPGEPYYRAAAKVAPQNAFSYIDEKAHISTLTIASPLPVYKRSIADPGYNVVNGIPGISSSQDTLPSVLRPPEIRLRTSLALAIKGPLSETQIPVTSPIQLQMDFASDKKSQLNCSTIDTSIEESTQPLKPAHRKTYPPVGVGGPRQSRRRTYGHTSRPSPLRNIATYYDEPKRYRESDGLSNIIQELIDEASAWDADLFHDDKFKAMFDHSLKQTTLCPKGSVNEFSNRLGRIHSTQQCITILEEQEPSSPGTNAHI